MVPRSNLGGDFIYTICHGPPWAKAYFPQIWGNTNTLLQALVPTPILTINFSRKTYSTLSYALILSSFIAMYPSFPVFLFCILRKVVAALGFLSKRVNKKHKLYKI